MTARDELKGFLTSRRARLTPTEAGVTAFGGKRRVPGLRREEVAQLAGVSTDYYSKLERGDARGVSREVLDAIARALQLDDTEHRHLLDLVDSTSTSPARRRRVHGRQSVAPGTQAVLDALTVPAVVQNARLDFLAANRLGAALYGIPDPATAAEVFNAARYQFLDPRAQDFFVDLARTNRNAVALLHQAAGRSPDDEALVRLIGQLSTQSREFRALWASHDVIRYQRGKKRYRHPAVGALEFDYESYELTTEPGLTMLVYTFEPHSPTAERIALLGSLAHTTDAPEATAAASEPHIPARRTHPTSEER